MLLQQSRESVTCNPAVITNTSGRHILPLLVISSKFTLDFTAHRSFKNTHSDSSQGIRIAGIL